MKIAVSSTGDSLDAPLDPRFGRCACFLIVDPVDMSYEVFDNRSIGQSGGAGIQAAQFLAQKGVGAVITGHVGPNATETLSAAGIKVFAQQQGTITEVVENFKKGHLNPTIDSTVDRHFGMNGNTGPVAGRGLRQGPGGGRGMGQTAGRGGGMRKGQLGGGRGAGRRGGMQRS